MPGNIREHPMRILVVDDEEEPRRRLSDLLQSSGYVVMEASSGREALAMLQDEELDLVITDIVMPEMDGLELVHRMKSEYPALKAIVLSASDYSQDGIFLKMAQVLGAAGAFKKSISAERLLEAVEAFGRR